MNNKPLIIALVLSLLIHLVFLFNLQLTTNNLLLTDGSTEISISIGSIEQEEPRLSRLDEQARPAVAGSSSTNKNDLSGEEKNSYLAQIRKRIAEFKKYPETAKARNWQGSPKVEFTILKDGNINQLKLINPSKYEVLNNEALETIKRACPFPPIPASLQKSVVIIALDLVFKLE